MLPLSRWNEMCYASLTLIRIQSRFDPDQNWISWSCCGAGYWSCFANPIVQHWDSMCDKMRSVVGLGAMVKLGFVKIWRQDRIQCQLCGRLRNNKLLGRIVGELGYQGFYLTIPLSCRNLKALKQKDKDLWQVQKNGAGNESNMGGDAPTDFPYFDAVMSGMTSVSPVALIDSSLCVDALITSSIIRTHFLWYNMMTDMCALFWARLEIPFISCSFIVPCCYNAGTSNNGKEC